MFLSLALIFSLGLFLGFLSKRLHLPSLIGMIIAGMVLGPDRFNLLDQKMLCLSTDLRKIALLIILIRAGLKLDLQDIKKSGKSALLMSFLPASFELLAIGFFAPKLLNIPPIQAVILGAVLSAVSPAVIVPRMIGFIEEGAGTHKGIPQLTFVGSSLDDVFVIVIFQSFMTLAQGQDLSFMSLLQVPISITSGLGMGLLTGYVFSRIQSLINLDRVTATIVLLTLAFSLTVMEDYLQDILPLASLISVMVMGMVLRQKNPHFSHELSQVFQGLWIPSEIFLFVLLGSSVKIISLKNLGGEIILLIFVGLVFRSLGVLLSIRSSNFNMKEKLFCILAYLPKATVQAAIGGLPLAMGMKSGELILTASVAAILITAPLGALFIDLKGKKLLSSSQD